MIWNLGARGNRIAVEENLTSYTYAELNQITEEIASQVEKRCLVFLLTKNTVGSLAGYLSFLDHGIVPLMLDEKIDRTLLNNLIDQYEPRYLWVPEEILTEFEQFHLTFSGWNYGLLETGIKESFSLHPDLALLINTSGSIGSPKLVRQSYRNILSNAESIIDYLDIDSQEKAITSLPMNYVYGLSVINSHILAGASIFLTDLNCYTAAFWNLFDEKQVTSFSGVPFMYEMLHKLRFTKEDHPSLRTMTQAGGKLSPELQEYFGTYAHHLGKRFFVMYGASEATSRMGYLPDRDALRKLGSMGIAIPGGCFELIDEEGVPITESEQPGELVYYGPNVMLGYAYNGADLNKGDELHGRLVTGDMAYRDEEGYYYISGRKSRFIKILGKRLSLDETEMLLKNHFPDVQIACGGKDDLLCVFITDNKIQKDIAAYLNQTIQINHALCRVIPIEEIPKNIAGKTLYAELNKLI